MAGRQPHHQHAVVEVLAALAADDAGAIELQGTAGADGHADGLLGGSLDQGSLIARGDVLVAINGDHSPAGRQPCVAGLVRKCEAVMHLTELIRENPGAKHLDHSQAWLAASSRSLLCISTVARPCTPDPEAPPKKNHT